MKVLFGPNMMGLERGIPQLQRDYPNIEFVHCPDQKVLAEFTTEASTAQMVDFFDRLL